MSLIPILMPTLLSLQSLKISKTFSIIALDIESYRSPKDLATSRKSVIGLTLDLPKDQREEGTMATTVYGVMKGCRFVRVHDVAANKRAIDMTEAILSAQ